MKKIYTLVLLVVSATAVLAQSAGNVDLSKRKPTFIPQREAGKAAHVAGTSSFYIDYDYAENFTYDPEYDWFIWDLNGRYVRSQGDSTQGSLKYAVCAFDSLYDPYNMVAIANADVDSITIDSIFLNIGHKNTSGTNDTIKVSIINLNNNGYPNNVNSVLWSDQIVTNVGLSSGNNWLQTKTINFVPKQKFKVKRFGVKIDYYGAKQDTFGILAGFHKNSQPCGSGSFSAYRTDFWINSTSLWMYFESYGMLPLANGADIYYDCNGNNTYETGIDGENYIQNLNIWTYVTVKTLVGVSENEAAGLKLHQNKPNPFNGTSEIAYELAKAGNVSLEIFDITGRLVTTVNEGMKVAGKHSLTLDATLYPQGTYFYTLKADGVSLTRKMVITE